MSRSLTDRLLDIQHAIRRARTFRDALDGANAEMALSAVLREIGVIGEAVRALPDDVTARQPHVPWRQIAGMRNFLVHEYFNIDKTVVEDVIANDLEPLAEVVVPLLAEHG